MRIAHVTATFPPYYAGTGTVCYHNALGLARLGHDVTVITAAHPPGDHAYPPEITVRRLPILFRIGNAPLLPDLLRLDGFDLIHLHYPFIFGAEMIWAVSRLRGIPYILTHHNDLIGAGLRRHLFNAYSATLTRLVVRGARKFAVVSLDHAASCRLTPLFRERWHDVVEVPNGVDADHFRPELDRLAVRRKHGIPDGAPVVVFVGALDRAHHYRRVDLLIQAVHSLGTPDVHLIIVGDGDQVADHKQLAESIGLGPRVHFTGSIQHEQLPPMYSAADIVVLPSQLQESFGLVLIEAMACGKPVIASNLPGVRTVVHDGVDGLLVRSGDPDDLAAKIQALLDDPARARDMGTRGRQKVEQRYAWPVIIPRLIQLYESILA